MNTETIDKLFLELSQVTNATTRKELQLMDALRELVKLKAIKERLEQPQGVTSDECMQEMRDEYETRKPLAWKAARILVYPNETLHSLGAKK